jgi:soluble lytic murein transglycosylase-like protein
MDSSNFSPLPDQHAASLADDIALSRIKPEFRDEVMDASQTYNVPVSVIANVMKMESNSNAHATSKAGAMGLMQLMPGTFKYLGGKGDPYEPSQNVNLGTKYLGQLINQFGGNVDMALAAYNAGPGRIAKTGLNNLPSETSNYLDKFHKLMGGEGQQYVDNKITNLPQKQVNASVNDIDGSIQAMKPLEDARDNFVVQPDFPRQAQIRKPISGLSDILGVEDILG